MNKYSIIFLVLTLSLIISCKFHTGASHGSEADNGTKAYLLKFNPPAGTRYYDDITRESEYNLEVNDQKIDKLSKLDAGVYYTISKDSAGNYALTMQYDKIHLHTKNENTETDEDADQPVNAFDPVSGMLHALKNAKISATITPTGIVKSITGYQEIEESILSNMNVPDAITRDKIQYQLDQLIGNKLVKANMEQLFKFFPDSAVHVGDQWTSNSKETDGVSINVKTTYTLESIDQDKADIKSRSEMTGNNSEADFIGTPVTANLKGYQKGEYEIEITTGMLVKSKLSSNLKGTLQMSGREVPVTMEGNVKIEGRSIN